MTKVPEVGIDEVGRGAVFGPVFSAVVVLTEENKFILKKLKEKPSQIIVDGPLSLRPWSGIQKNIISADSKFTSVASASIVAKVSRDNLMVRLERKYSGYSIFKNKGYGTKEHLTLIKKI